MPVAFFPFWDKERGKVALVLPHFDNTLRALQSASRPKPNENKKGEIP